MTCNHRNMWQCYKKRIIFNIYCAFVGQIREGADKSLARSGRNLINNIRGGHCFRSSRTRHTQVEKSPRLNWATQFLTVAYDGACFAWISFGVFHAGKKNWRQLGSRCYWNRARGLTCLISASITRKALQFGTGTEPSFQRHYRFRPMTSGNRSG